MSKLSTGYWHLFDPTNGFTAIEGRVASVLPLNRVNRRFFFESDLLFHLSLIRARVVELPMVSVYPNVYRSNLSELKALITFPFLHWKNFNQRILCNYFLRNFSLASVNLVLSLGLLFWGLFFGCWTWLKVISSGTPSTAGTVMLAALPTLVGFQLLLSFLAYDMALVPQHPIHPRISQLVPRQRLSRNL